jgi:hypothetical protein
MIKKLTEIFFIAALIVFFSSIAGCVKHYSDVKGKIKKGQSRQTIIELLGKPLEKRIITKRNKFIWGPEEDFWDKIPMGSRLEVWKYVFSDGRLNLYFINDGKQLEYMAFAPKGVIY